MLPFTNKNNYMSEQLNKNSRTQEEKKMYGCSGSL